MNFIETMCEQIHKEERAQINKVQYKFFILRKKWLTIDSLTNEMEVWN